MTNNPDPSVNNPDCWILVDMLFEGGVRETKILAGWSGGYLDGDYWKLNSGVKDVEEGEDFYVVTGHSGSKYYLYKGFEEVRMAIGEPLSRIVEHHDGRVIRMRDYLIQGIQGREE